MASFIPDGLNEPPHKRQKLSPSPPCTNTTNIFTAQDCRSEEGMLKALKMANEDLMSQLEREAEVGILRFVNLNNLGFSGILKQRYTDFVVNEITLNGNVVHLTDIAYPRGPDSRKARGLNSSSSAKTSRKPKSSSEAPEEAGDLAAAVLPTQARAGQHVPTEIVVANNTTPECSLLNPEDIALLDSYFDTDIQRSIVNMHERILQRPNAKPASFGTIYSQRITDRQLRTQIHKDVRRIFNSRLETAGSPEGIITIFAGRQNQPQASRNQGRDKNRESGPKGKLGWQELGGEYLHFSLYKENRDTMEVINFISRGTKIGAKKFKFAGTKDRRAVTVQRVSVIRVHAEQLANLNKTLQGAKLGNFNYEKHGLELGDLGGNEFLITLRDCRFHGIEHLSWRQTISLADKVIGNALKNLQEHGFINYYGLQRFGSFGVGTDEVGLKILRGDFEGAVSAILTYSEEALAAALDPDHIMKDQKPLPHEDKARAHAIYIFQTTGNSHLALEKMPKKFHAESNVIRHLSRQDRKTDFIGALLTINRNMRLMYLHAYQSLVWNMAASERWSLFGRSVVKGDLVLEGEDEENGGVSLENEMDENGEAVFAPGEYDTALSRDQFERARALTLEDVASGRYTIFDVVLPTPGFDIEYPNNEIGDYYKEFMASEKGGGLDPADMCRKHRDFSLSGSYRKLLARLGDDFGYQIKTYVNDNEQMVETDMERIMEPKSLPNSFNKIPLDNEDKMRDSVQLDARINNFTNADKSTAKIFAVEKPTNPENSPFNGLPGSAIKETFIQTASTEKRFERHEETDETTYSSASIDSKQTPTFSSVNAEFAASQSSSSLWKKNRSSTFQTNNEPAETPPRLWKHKNTVFANAAEPAASSIVATSAAVVATHDLPATKIPISKPSTAETDESQSLETTDDEIIVFEGRDPTGQRVLKRQANEPFMDEAQTQKELDYVEDREPKKIAVIVKFQLASSQYATMALRELMSGGVQLYQADFGRGQRK